MTEQETKDAAEPPLDCRVGLNPNNCENCKYKQYHDMGCGWCYMFRDEPTDVCMVHSGRHPTSLAEQVKLAQQMLDAIGEVPNA